MEEIEMRKMLLMAFLFLAFGLFAQTASANTAADLPKLSDDASAVIFPATGNGPFNSFTAAKTLLPVEVNRRPADYFYAVTHEDGSPLDPAEYATCENKKSCVYRFVLSTPANYKITRALLAESRKPKGLRAPAVEVLARFQPLPSTVITTDFPNEKPVVAAGAEESGVTTIDNDVVRATPPASTPEVTSQPAHKNIMEEAVPTSKPIMPEPRKVFEITDLETKKVFQVGWNQVIEQTSRDGQRYEIILPGDPSEIDISLGNCRQYLKYSDIEDIGGGMVRFYLEVDNDPFWSRRLLEARIFPTNDVSDDQPRLTLRFIIISP